MKRFISLLLIFSCCIINAQSITLESYTSKTSQLKGQPKRVLYIKESVIETIVSIREFDINGRLISEKVCGKDYTVAYEWTDTHIYKKHLSEDGIIIKSETILYNETPDGFYYKRENGEEHEFIFDEKGQLIKLSVALQKTNYVWEALYNEDGSEDKTVLKVNGHKRNTTIVRKTGRDQYGNFTKGETIEGGNSSTQIFIIYHNPKIKDDTKEKDLENTNEYIMSANESYYFEKDYPKAVGYFEKAAEIFLKHKSTHAGKYLETLEFIADVYDKAKHYSGEIGTYKRYSEAIEDTDERSARIYYKIAGLYKKQKLYDDARLYYEKCIGLRSLGYISGHANYVIESYMALETLGSDDKISRRDYVKDYYNQAEKFYPQNKSTSLKYAELALKKEKEYFGENSVFYARISMLLGKIYRHEGRTDKRLYTQAAEHYLTAARIYKSIYEYSSNHIDATYKAGGIYYFLEDYPKALKYITEASESCTVSRGENVEVNAICLTGIGNIYYNLNDYNNALLHFQRSVEIQKNLSLEKSEDYYSNLKYIGFSYYYLGEYKKALEYLLPASKKVHYYFKEEVMSMIGESYMGVKDYDKALESYLLLCEEIKGGTLPQNKYNYSCYLRQIAAIYYRNEDYFKALDYSYKAFDVRLNINRDINHQFCITCIVDIVKIRRKLDKTDNESLPLMIESLGVQRNILNRDLSVSTEQERENIVDNLGYFFSTYKTIAATHNDTQESGKLLFDLSLLNKGLLLNTTREIRQLISDSGNEQLLKSWREFQELKNKLSKIYNTTAENRPGDIQELEQKVKSLEEDVMVQMNLSKLKIVNIYYDWTNVQDNLKPNELAVEFVSTKLEGENLYCASVLRKGWESPLKVTLDFKGKTMAKNNGGEPEKYDNAEIGKAIWGGILKYAKKGDKIYFSPDGALNQIAIEYLMVDDNNRINELYNMERVSSTRHISKKTSNTHFYTAALYGGLNYNVDTEDMLYYAEAIEENSGTRGRFNNQKRDRTAWNYLRGTRLEVENIETLLKDNKYETTLYTGDEGIEESFKSLSGKNTGIIHIATHGFYTPDRIERNSDIINVETFYNQQTYEEKIMKNSGLIFSGANNSWVGNTTLPENIEDGILTSAEISRLDLSNTELVVLSACQTGLGDITEEGVLGLQRAFKKAGAETIIMSLWSVSDEATQTMMTEFYKALKDKVTQREALAKAQEAVKNRTFIIDGKEHSGSDPFFWAGFVIID